MRLVRLMMACTIFVATVLCFMPQKGNHVLADSVQGPITAFGNVGSPTFGNSDDFFYAIDRPNKVPAVGESLDEPRYHATVRRINATDPPRVFLTDATSTTSPIWPRKTKQPRFYSI